MLSSVPSNYWWGVASSADGSKLVAIGANTPTGAVHSSTNSGVNWTPIPAPIHKAWGAIASSADGTKLVAVPAFSPIYTSTNSGATWRTTSTPSLWWTSVASSADGTKLFAAVGGVGDIKGPIYRSLDSGNTWTQTSAPIDGWSSLASSADGTKVVAAVGKGLITGSIYTSTNSGDTWTSNSVPIQFWNSVTSSADGNKLAAVVLHGGIYTLQTPPEPPTITCPAPITLECSNGAVATLQAHVEDAHGNPVEVVWLVDDLSYQTNYIPSGGPVTSTDVTFTANFGYGEHSIVVSASNGQTAATICSTTLTIRDTIAPQISFATATPSVLWPPNNQMVTVQVVAETADDCSSATVRIISVDSDERISRDDWKITGDLTVELRARRSRVGRDRIYKIVIECSDAAGNTSLRTIAITVPHDKRVSVSLSPR